jgi:hypothetical protein
MTKLEIEKWADKEGRTLPRKKSNGKYGLPKSSLLDENTWEESYKSLCAWGYNKGINYPDLT